ncbi:MAG: hypothetical protein JJE25_10615 [Bacteroidia bacterium]|nr:hypothetical protein [Bacteroidia bacterium]
MIQDENNNNISPEEAGKILALFDNLERRDKAVYDDLDAAIKNVIEKHYPGIFHLESDGYRRLSDRVSRHIVSLRREVSDIIHLHKIK